MIIYLDVTEETGCLINDFMRYKGLLVPLIETLFFIAPLSRFLNNFKIF